jgi:TonB family protein
LHLFVGQTKEESILPRVCSSAFKEHLPFPREPFKLLPGESYKRSPIIKYLINPDGSISNVKLVRSSEVEDIERTLLAAVSNWKYKPQSECGIVEAQIGILIDWN